MGFNTAGTIFRHTNTYYQSYTITKIIQLAKEKRRDSNGAVLYSWSSLGASINKIDEFLQERKDSIREHICTSIVPMPRCCSISLLVGVDRNYCSMEGIESARISEIQYCVKLFGSAQKLMSIVHDPQSVQRLTRLGFKDTEQYDGNDGTTCHVMLLSLANDMEVRHFFDVTDE